MRRASPAPRTSTRSSPRPSRSSTTPSPIAPPAEPATLGNERGRSSDFSNFQILPGGHPSPPRARIETMKATQALHDLGQSLWLDNITRDLLDGGTLERYIRELSVTGLTSNPTIFDHAIKQSRAYDGSIREKLAKGVSGEALFFELALEDLTRAADLFRPIHQKTDGVDGWVSLEVSPLLAHDTKSTIAAAKELFARGERANLYIKIPGTREG